MNGIENITGRINADAQVEIDAIVAEGTREAEKIRAGYAARAERESADILARGKKSAEERGSRLVSAAQMEARKMNLAAKQDVLDEAFQLALDKLTKLPEDEYIALLAKLAVSASNTGSESLIMNSADSTRYGAKVVAAANDQLKAAGKVASLTLSEQTRAIPGGLILSDGSVEVNCALDTLVRLSRSEITGEVSKLLFA